MHRSSILPPLALALAGFACQNAAPALPESPKVERQGDQISVPAGSALRERLFGDFLARVGRSNLDLAAQRTNITIAEAEISIARIFPDPSMTGGLASVDVSRLGAPTVTTLGVSQLIELGGKRRARVRAATAQRTVAQADAEDFLRVLRANAAGAFIDAVAARLELEQKRRSLDSLQRFRRAAWFRSRWASSSCRRVIFQRRNSSQTLLNTVLI